MPVFKKKAGIRAVLWGGLGNQLFIYAMARRLSLANNLPLVIDTCTGFRRDYKYQRKFSLHHFQLPMDILFDSRYDYFARFRRVLKTNGLNDDITAGGFLREESLQFDPRVLNVKVARSLVVEGYWHSGKYFEDVSGTLRDDLKLKQSPVSSKLAKKLRGTQSVGMHVRRSQYADVVSVDYYHKALSKIRELHPEVTIYCFTDSPAYCEKEISREFEFELVQSHDEIEDFKLFSCCQHFIISNSSYSWWAAWLGADRLASIVCAPQRWHLGNPLDSPSWWYYL